jgi:hypothetical protein
MVASLCSGLTLEPLLCCLRHRESQKFSNIALCMLNVSFKIFTKVIANRLALVASKVIGPSQSAFLPGRIF